MRSSNLDINCSARQWSWNTDAPSFRGRSRHGRHAVPDRTFSESRPFARVRIACAGVSSNFRPGPGCLKHFRFRESIPPLPIKRSNYTEHDRTRLSTPRLQRSPHSSASASLYFDFYAIRRGLCRISSKSRKRTEDKNDRMKEMWP